MMRPSSRLAVLAAVFVTGTSLTAQLPEKDVITAIQLGRANNVGDLAYSCTATRPNATGVPVPIRGRDINLSERKRNPTSFILTFLGPSGRIALAARAAQQAGRRFTPANVPAGEAEMYMTVVVTPGVDATARGAQALPETPTAIEFRGVPIVVPLFRSSGPANVTKGVATFRLDAAAVRRNVSHPGGIEAGVDTTHGPLFCPDVPMGTILGVLK